LAENLYIPKGANRQDIFDAILPQIRGLVDGEPDFVANIANIVAVLKSAFNFFWVGCYFVKHDLNHKAELVLGPFQGPVACTRIAFGCGVCGTSWAENRSILVPNVELFSGHIACSAESKSEVVVPLRSLDGSVFGVLDVDSDVLNDFGPLDLINLEKVANIIREVYERV